MQKKPEDRFVALVKDRGAKKQSLNYCLVLLTVLYHRIVMKHEMANQETTGFIPSLFWSYCFPEKFEPLKGPMEDALSDLTENDFEIVLHGLEKLETAMRVLYQPDGEEPVLHLTNYVHVAACRALLLKKRQGYSDDVRWLFGETNRAIARFEQAVKTAFFDYRPSTDYERSFAAVAGLVQIEVARLRLIDCKYQEALGCFAAGLSYLSSSTASTSENMVTHEDYVSQIDVDPQEVVECL